jgi:hypothetical protein
MTFWLILTLYGGGNSGTFALHVGNFASMAECVTAGKGAQIATTGRDVAFVCVQANGNGMQPPN